MAQDKRKTILFFPLNSPGHINSSLGIADMLKQYYNCRTVFLLLGPMIGTSVVDHGHELVILKEVSPLVDTEIDLNQDDSGRVSVDDEEKDGLNKPKVTFEGVFKWPQLLRKYSNLFHMHPVDAFIESAKVMEHSMVTELAENHDNYAREIEKIKPDLIIIDAYYIPPCVVNSSVPWARLYSASPLMLTRSKLKDGVKPPPMIGLRLYDKSTRERFRRDEPNKWEAIVSEWRETGQRIMNALGQVGILLNDFLVKNNCSPLPPGQQAHDSPHINIYMYPRVLDYDQDDDLMEYPPYWLRCDSLIRHASLAGSTESQHLSVWKQALEKASQGKEAIVYFSLGSLASGDPVLMARFVDFLKKDQKRLYVISKGVNGDKYELDPGNMIGGNYVPQDYFLQKVDLAIIHGGNNSVTECCYYGKPMIVLPVFADQFDNAQRVEDLKYGRRLNVRQCTGEELIQAVDDVLSDKQMIDRMRQVGELMQKLDSPKKITDLLMKLANQGFLTQEQIDKCRV